MKLSHFSERRRAESIASRAAILAGLTSQIISPGLARSWSTLLVGILVLAAAGLAGLYDASAQGTQGASSSQLQPTIGFKFRNYSVPEGGTAVISVVISETPVTTATVEYLTVDGTAKANVDYLPANGLLIFTPSGATEQSFFVQTIEDSIQEGDDTVNLILRNPVNAQLDANNSTAVMIIDNDDLPPPRISFELQNYFVSEGAGTASITVKISRPPDSTAYVEYLTLDGTAQSPYDYLSTMGVLTFTPWGATSMTFDITIVDDNMAEPSEKVNLVLRNQVNAVLDPHKSIAILTIVDDGPTQFLPIIKLWGPPQARSCDSDDDHNISRGIGYDDIIKRDLATGIRHRWDFLGLVNETATVTVAAAPGLDVALDLVNPNGRIIATQDERGDGEVETANQTLATTGTYQIYVCSTGDTSGDYSLLLQNDDSLPFIVFRGNLDYGDSGSGDLPEDVDHFWNFEGTVGEIVSITVTPTSGDLVLYLNGADGVELEFVDESGYGGSEQIVDFELPSTGYYSIGVGELDFNPAGYLVTLMG
jgi:hypothetical protein